MSIHLACLATLDGTNRMSVHLDMNLTDIAFSNYHFDCIHTNHGKW